MTQMRKKNRDDDPMIDFPLTTILRESKVGLCVRIFDLVVWVPRVECEWTDTTIAMPRSLAVQNSLMED